MITSFLVVTLAWYALRGLARWWAWAGRVVGRLSPYTRGLHAWVLAAPATFVYIAVFTSSTLLQKTAPRALINLLTTIQSTNLAHLSTRPLIALADSALWVADKGSGLVFYVAVFASVVAWAEPRYGTPRIIVIVLCGHVFGSLLTAVVEWHAIETGKAPARLAHTTDVGVSYIMVAGCAAAVVLMRGRWRIAGAMALGAGVVLPVFVTHTIWDLGHLFATACGLAAALLSLRLAPPRTPPDVRPCLPGRTVP
ncbi:rhomboid-like protein [Streptosporangium sp. NPDC051023]|uniref:rhomboid-like protein n=1 Tax=Streptosporangium sp. NPDC051023 TaxID=3155410 RepID=UPI00344FB9FC